MKHQPVAESRRAVARSVDPMQDDKKVSKRQSRLRSYLYGAGTVFDLAGYQIKLPALGSVRDDPKAIMGDMWVLRQDLNRVLRAERSLLKK